MIVWLIQLRLLQRLGFDMKNQIAQNAAVVRASILWYNHPKQRSRPAYRDCLAAIEQTVPDIPMVQE